MKSLVMDYGLFRPVSGKLGGLPEIMKIGGPIGNHRIGNKGNHHLAGFSFIYLIRYCRRNAAAGTETERGACIVAMIPITIIRGFCLHVIDCRYAGRAKIIHAWLHNQVKDVNGKEERKPFHASNI